MVQLSSIQKNHVSSFVSYLHRYDEEVYKWEDNKNFVIGADNESATFSYMFPLFGYENFQGKVFFNASSKFAKEIQEVFKEQVNLRTSSPSSFYRRVEDYSFVHNLGDSLYKTIPDIFAFVVDSRLDIYNVELINYLETKKVSYFHKLQFSSYSPHFPAVSYSFTFNENFEFIDCMLHDSVFYSVNENLNLQEKLQFFKFLLLYFTDKRFYDSLDISFSDLNSQDWKNLIGLMHMYKI